MLLCIIYLVMLSSGDDGRSVRPIKIARKALEAQFRQKMMTDERKYEWPSRVSPGGPDPHHHYKND